MRSLLFLCVLPACAGHDWRVASSTDTSTAYATFVANNPGHPKVGLATRRSETLSWEEAQSVDTSSAYDGYLGAHPSGEHADEARTRAEALAWDEAVAAGTPDALSIYVARHPGTPHAGEAEGLIEEAWYRQAKGTGTEESWGRYVVRYPRGQWAEEAKSERQRLAWEAAVTGNSRASYESFVDRYPDTSHRAEADAWLLSSRVLTLQPVVILKGTWQADSAHASLLWRVRNEVEKGLLTDLKRDFKVSATKTEDPRGAELVHPQDVYGVTPDVGLLVLEYTEVAGRAFEPSGHATDITATLSLYAPPTKVPVWSTTLEVSTPERTYGETVDALQLGAVKELAGTLRSFVPELASNRKGAK